MLIIILLKKLNLTFFNLKVLSADIIANKTCTSSNPICSILSAVTQTDNLTSLNFHFLDFKIEVMHTLQLWNYIQIKLFNTLDETKH